DVGGRHRPLVFFQAEDGIRDFHVTGVQTCALPICHRMFPGSEENLRSHQAVDRVFQVERTQFLALNASLQDAFEQVVARVDDFSDRKSGVWGRMVGLAGSSQGETTTQTRSETETGI